MKGSNQRGFSFRINYKARLFTALHILTIRYVIRRHYTESLNAQYNSLYVFLFDVIIVFHFSCSFSSLLSVSSLLVLYFSLIYLLYFLLC
jgi:hypothetical protein